MPAYGYEFYLLVVNSISRYRVDHSKIKFISTRGHVISSMYLITILHLLSFLILINFNNNGIYIALYIHCCSKRFTM